MFARTKKDLALEAVLPAERDRHLRRAAKAYAEAYQLTGGYWTGINAATLTLLSGDEAGAKSLAGLVQRQCLEVIAQEGADH